jgi:hypothetical protein
VVTRGPEEVQSSIGSGNFEVADSVMKKPNYNLLTQLTNNLPSMEMVKTQEGAGMVPVGTLSKLMEAQGLISKNYSGLLSSPGLKSNAEIPKLLQKQGMFEQPITPKEVAPLLAELVKVLSDDISVTRQLTTTKQTITVTQPETPPTRNASGGSR